LLRAKRCVLLSVSRSRALVASVAGGSAVVEIVVDGIEAEEIAVDVTRRRVRLLVGVRRVDAIRGWIRCASDLRRVGRGRVRLTMKSWI